MSEHQALADAISAFRDQWEEIAAELAEIRMIAAACPDLPSMARLMAGLDRLSSFARDTVHQAGNELAFAAACAKQGARATAPSVQ